VKRRLLLGCVVALVPALPLHAAEAAEPAGRRYAPGPFDSLSFGGAAVVQFHQGERDEVFVEGDDEVQRNLRLELRGSELVVRSEGNWRFWARSDRVRLRVTMRELKSLVVSGAADFVASGPLVVPRLRVDISGAAAVRFEQLRADELRFTVSGSGDGHFAGSVGALAVAISGRSDFFGEQLMSRSARVVISGMGKARVWVTGELSTAVSGIGTIEYWGRPNVSRRSSGVATVNDMGPKEPRN
jgi:hypothetical protein